MDVESSRREQQHDHDQLEDGVGGPDLVDDDGPFVA